MTNPWDARPYPATGDETNDAVFCAVGAALSTWEWFEGYLSIVFSLLIGAGSANFAAMRAYGSVQSFAGRRKMIANAAEVVFRKVGDVALHGRLKELLRRGEKFASRRNEIAHGIVNPYVVVEDARATRKGWVLYPAYYAAAKRKLSAVPDARAQVEITEPTYLYSSKEIMYFQQEFNKLASEAIDVLTDLTRYGRRAPV